MVTTEKTWERIMIPLTAKVVVVSRDWKDEIYGQEERVEMRTTRTLVAYPCRTYSLRNSKTTGLFQQEEPVSIHDLSSQVGSSHIGEYNDDFVLDGEIPPIDWEVYVIHIAVLLNYVDSSPTCHTRKEGTEEKGGTETLRPLKVLRKMTVLMAVDLGGEEATCGN
jgi:hypothetical protein